MAKKVKPAAASGTPAPAGKLKPGPKKLAVKKLAAKKLAMEELATRKLAPGKRAGKPPAAARLARALHRVADTPDANPALDGTVLDRLAATVTARRTADPAISHSARLMARGTAKVAQKFGEEAVECLIEAVAGNRDALVAESADVLYHLVVLWVDAGLAPSRVWEELHRREGVSGIAEKARRKINLPTTKIP